MSTAIYPPPASAADLRAKRQAVADRELQWLLSSLQETLHSLREGVEECLLLLNPSDTTTTLAVSTHLSEAVKGHITRSGISLLRGNISLNLPTLPSSPSTHTISSPYPIPSLTSISGLLSESSLLITTILDTHPMTAPFLREHLRLLREQLSLITSTLCGTSDPNLPIPSIQRGPTSTTNSSASTPTAPPLFINHPSNSSSPSSNLSPTVLPPSIFTPPLPASICLTLALGNGVDAPTFILTARTLAAADAPALSIRERLGLAQVPRHDESAADVQVTYGERQVRVREKVRVGVVDPGMVSLGAKVGAMGRVVRGAEAAMEAVVGSVEAVRMEG